MKQENIKYFGLVFWIHLMLVSFAYLSPFLFNWKLIILGIIVLFIQYSWIGGCILNKIQFDEIKDITFLYPYIKMLGLNVNPYKFKIFIRYYLPFILFLIAIIWQVLLNKTPIIM